MNATDEVEKNFLKTFWNRTIWPFGMRKKSHKSQAKLDHKCTSYDEQSWWWIFQIHSVSRFLQCLSPIKPPDSSSPCPSRYNEPQQVMKPSATMCTSLVNKSISVAKPLVESSQCENSVDFRGFLLGNISNESCICLGVILGHPGPPNTVASRLTE